VYVILLTSRDAANDTIEGLSAGADDFITKPFNPGELAVRVRTGERILGLEMRDLTIFALAKLAESRDPETGAHLERVQNYSRVLATHLMHEPAFAQEVDASFVRLIYQTSPLHDIGKVGIPDAVLLKAGRLTPEEYAIMKLHTLKGADAGSGVEGAPRGELSANGAGYRAVPPRALGWRGLSASVGGDENSAVRAYRGGGGCVRRADVEAGVQGRVFPRDGAADDRGRRGSAF
jgi:response regulator RpfG family c-di-GMP phosphodiesterase